MSRSPSARIHPTAVVSPEAVIGDNADIGALAYLMRPSHRASLKTTQRFASTDSHRREGIGLVNTRARLQQLYGSEQRIDCFDAIGGGACVAIWIPFRMASLAA